MLGQMLNLFRDKPVLLLLIRRVLYDFSSDVELAKYLLYCVTQFLAHLANNFLFPAADFLPVVFESTQIR